MPAQVDLPLEAAATRLAGKGFESRVFPAVGDKVGWLAESFSTVATFIWLFTWNYILELYLLTVHSFTRKHMDSTKDEAPWQYLQMVFTTLYLSAILSLNVCFDFLCAKSVK